MAMHNLTSYVCMAQDQGSFQSFYEIGTPFFLLAEGTLTSKEDS